MRHLRFEEEVEKRRVLEDALHVLATEHHALECSIGAHEVQMLLFIFPPRLCPSAQHLHGCSVYHCMRHILATS